MERTHGRKKLNSSSNKFSIEKNPHVSLCYPVQTNQIFFSVPFSWIPMIQEKVLCYPWDREKHELRFIASWCTTEQDVERVRALFAELPSH